MKKFTWLKGVTLIAGTYGSKKPAILAIRGKKELEFTVKHNAKTGEFSAPELGEMAYYHESLMQMIYNHVHSIEEPESAQFSLTF